VPAVRRIQRDAPGLRVEILLGSAFVDLVEEGVDMAIRIGTLPDSDLIAQRLIHGHTHRPDRHRVILDAQGALGERIVLGDWHKLGWCLRAEGTHLNLESWPLDK